ncbi:hypothetical protein [Enterobacter roggenkampii]|uniref:hypothetical protein n=1 Tax=Enterobacter roggenkampii TaxID=1812935 RepID=UPI002A82096B|nr:hypothetical protein [Enterobacter roggenkampii]
MDNNTVIKHVKRSTNKEVKVSLIIMWLMFFISSWLFLYNDILGDKYSWLFISPSYLDKGKLTWINGSWGAVLSIHGTIAALSITFMGMFVQQVADASNKDFVNITRQLVLREYKFYQFSVDAICGLLFGIFFIVVGGGVIQYGFSMACSLYFIMKYMEVFKHLYFITEKKEIIETILLRKMKVVSEYVYEMNKKSRAIKAEYDEFLKQCPSLTVKYDMDINGHTEVKLDDPFLLRDEIIVGFNEKGLRRLQAHITKEYDGGHVRVYLSPGFYDSSFIKDVYVFHDKEFLIESFDSLRVLISKCFKHDDVSEDLYFYYEIESNIIQSTFSALINDNGKQLEFCVENLYLIISSSQELNIFRNLERLMADMPSAKNMPIGMLLHFYKDLNWKLHHGYPHSAVAVFDSMLSLPRYIYEPQVYFTYISMSHQFIKDRVRYSSNEEYFGVYLKSSIKNLVYRQYDVLMLNTDFLTQELNLLRSNSYDQLDERQTMLLEVTKTMVSYISIRMEYLKSKVDDKRLNELIHIEEIQTLSNCLQKWLNPEFLQEVYYIPKTYDVLFSRTSRFESNTDELELKEVGEGRVVGINIGYHRAVALALLFFKGITYNNSLSIIYINDLADFIKNNNLTTFFIDKIINFIKSDSFKQLIELLELSQRQDELVDFESRKDNLLAAFEQLKSKSLQVALSGVITSSYNQKLVQDYNKGLTSDFLKALKEHVDLEAIHNDNFSSNLEFEFQIDKRELLDPINGEYFSQSHSIYANEIMKSIILKLVGEIDLDKVNVIPINDPNALPEGVKFVSMNCLEDDFEYSWRFYRGVRFKRDERVEPFTDNGFYYIDLSGCYEFYGNIAHVLNVQFGKTTAELLSKYNFEVSERNMETNARMFVSLMLRWEPKESQNVFFISDGDCREYLANVDKKS